MELKQVIAARRSIRKYLPDDVPQADIMTILESARLCQSARNRQPWRFMVLRGAEKNRVVDCMVQWVKDHPGEGDSSVHTARVIKQAPVLILVLREQGEHWSRYDEQSIGAAVKHMCLTATDMGLGALWIGHTGHAEKEILAAIGYPEMVLSCVMTVGHPAEAPEARPRLAMEELLLPKK